MLSDVFHHFRFAFVSNYSFYSSKGSQSPTLIYILLHVHGYMNERLYLYCIYIGSLEVCFSGSTRLNVLRRTFNVLVSFVFYVWIFIRLLKSILAPRHSIQQRLCLCFSCLRFNLKKNIDRNTTQTRSRLQVCFILLFCTSLIIYQFTSGIGFSLHLLCRSRHMGCPGVSSGEGHLSGPQIFAIRCQDLH